MGNLGSASIQLTLDRSQFDSDLTKLQQQDAGQIAYRIKLDTKDFERQLKGLSKLVSPIFIPLEIDTKTFDQQIKKLSTSIDPIIVDLAPNVKDFQEKLRRLSKISPIAVDIKVDEAKVRQQFEAVGKYAADGFSQGFSGVEGAGKSAVDSLIGSVNKQLGIQSPSKVFKEIGKFAIAGLMQGLDSVDESKLQGVVNKVENYFKKSKIKINLDVDASGISSKVKIQAPTPTEKPADFAKNITKSIEDGFQKAKPKTNFLGAIFGGLGELIAIPLASVIRGAFEGIGTPIGIQLGTGVTKAIQSTLGQNIGSLELISQKAVEKSLQAIPAAQSAIVEVIKSNPIGGAVVKQLELLQRTLELYSINLSPKNAVKSLATDSERAVASSSATFESQQSQFKSSKKAKASAANEFVSIVEQKGEVDKISESIKQKEGDLAVKAKKLAGAQSAIASLQTKQKNLTTLPAPKSDAEAKTRIATDTSLKKQITEMSQALMGGSLSIQQDIKDIQSLKDTKSAYLEKLNKQIKVLAELGIEKDLSGQTAEILKGVDVFEQMLSAQKAVANAQKNVKTNASTPEPIRQKKLLKLQGLATSAKSNLESALANPETDISEIPKLKKRSSAANKALDMYKLEISDPTKEIEKLNQKLANGNAQLAKNIQELQQRLTQAIPALFRNASEEVVKVGNLSEIPQNRPSAGQLAIERQAVASEQETKKALEIKKLKQQKADSVKNLPKLYVDAVQSVSRIVTGQNLAPEKIPNIVPSAEVQGRGDYIAKTNTYRIRPDLHQQLQTGDINQVAEEAIGNIVHEIFHAFQHNFGEAIADNTGQLAVDIIPTPKELLKLGDKVESSVAIQPDERKPLSRQLETGANVFQLRNTDRVREELKRNQLKGQALSLGGVAGSKIGLTDVNTLIDSVSGFLKEAKDLGVNVSAQRAKYLGLIKDIRAKAEAVGVKSVNIDSLPTIEIEEIVKQYQEIISSVDHAKSEVEELTQKLPQTQGLALQSELEKKALHTPVQKEIHPLAREFVDVPTTELPTPTNKSELEFNSSKDVHKFASTNLNAKGVKDLARRMGIDTKNTNKEHLLNEITSLGGTADSRGQIAQLVGQLTPDKFLSASNAKPKSNTPTDALKTIGELKKARKDLADALKIALELDGEAKRIVLEQISSDAREQEAIAKQLSSEYQLTPAHSKSLGGVRSQFKNISDQSKLSLESIETPRDIVPTQLLSPLSVAQQKPQGIFDIGLSKVDRSTEKKIKSGQQELKLATENFQKIFAEVIKASGLKPKEVEGQIPTVSFLHGIGKGAGQYSARGNRVALGMDVRKKLATGRIPKDDLDTLIHEVRHAIQLDFGRAKEANVERGQVGIPLLSTKKKADKNLALASTREYRNEFKRNRGVEPTREILQAVMALEEDAVAFAAEVTPQIHKNLKNILRPKPPIVGSKPTPFASQGQASRLLRNAIPPAPWEIDPSLDFRNLKPSGYASGTPRANASPTPVAPGGNPHDRAGSSLLGQQDPFSGSRRTTLFSTPKPVLPPPPPGFNLPITKTTLPPPPPGFNLPIGKSSAFPVPPTPEQVDPRFGVKALVPFERKTLSTVGQVKPNYEVRALVPYSSKLPALLQQPNPESKRSKLPTPPPPPGFDLPIKVKQLVDKVHDSGVLLNVASDIQKDQSKNLNRKIREFDRILQLIEDLKAEEAKQSAALDDKFDPELVERQRETIRQRAKLSAKLERKYGMTGLAPEILPTSIPELGETGKSPSIFQGIKDIFKSLENSVAKRVKKRAAQLAIEVDTAIAPSLEASALDAGIRGDKVEQKQYQKLAKQSRTTTTGIAKILATPGDLTAKQVKELDRLTSELEKVYDAIGRPLPSQGFLESIGVGAGGAIGLVKSLGGVIKGFLAFSIGMWAQNFFGSVAQEAFKAYVELDRLKTSLNFASGGTAGGAQSLAFVRKTVDDLKVPLKASAEGFTQLAAAAKGSALEGKGTREIFTGISQASTVLSLSADNTQGSILALSQMISKGKVSSEELRQQLGERLPGAMGIAARAMGLTEVEFTRLLDTGQILSQDFLPKFAKQLQAEFGDAAKDASGNAQSAIFGVENAFLSLQQGIGEGVAPVAITGLNIFAEILKGVASVAKELGFILLGVTAALGIKMVGALQAVIAQLIATKFATGTLGGGLAQLGQTINNSFSVKLAAGIFAVLEVVNLLNQAINTELVTSFSKAADAAKRAAEETKKAFEKPKPGKENQGTEPVATSGVGRVADSVIGFLNTDLGPIPGGVLGKKIKTYGQYERDNTANSIQSQGLSNVESLGEAKLQLAQFKTGTGDAGKLRAADAELKIAEEKRATLQAQIKRDYVDKGQSIPSDSRRQLESQNLNITALNEGRSEAGKPLTLELNRTIQKIGSIKTQLEQLQLPDNIAAQGGEAAADKQRQNLKLQLEPLKAFKAEMETALGALRIDPILAFTQSLRKLNLALAEGQEKSELRFNSSRVAIASTQLKGFSTNKLAARNASLQGAIAERDKNQDNVSDLEKAVQTTDATVNTSGFQSTLQRLGVTPDASVAKIDDVLKNTTDDADKGILEKLKSAREQKNKLSEARVGLGESQLKVKQTTQDNSLFRIDDKSADSSAVIAKNENLNIAGWKTSLEAKVVVEEVANEEIAKIQLQTTREQRKNLDDQLSAVRASHDAGSMSAEEFAKKERDLTTQQTALEKQEAENRIAVQSATLARRLKELEFFNKKAEALTATKQIDSTRANKEKLLSAGLTPQAQDQFSLDQTKVDAIAASDKVGQVKDRIAQSKQLYKEGKKDARDFMLEQYALNQELAQANVVVIDQKIAGEEKYRQTVDNNISRNQTIASTVVKKQSLASGLTPDSLDKAALDQNKIDQKAVSDRINFIKSRIGDEKNAVSAIAALEAQLVDLKIAQEQKYRENFERSIQRIMQAEENRFKKQVSQLDESKAKLDLYNQSLERTTKLETSHNNLSKALSSAAIAPLENESAETGDALGLAEKLKDPKIKGRVKRAIKQQLDDMGYQRGTPENYELQIKEKKATIEKAIALEKEKAMAREQEFQRKTQEFDLKRQQIAAQIAVYDAQGYQLAAQKSKLEADAALKIAIAKKDPLAIETAKVGVELADKQIVLSDRRVESAQANLNDQGEIAANSTLEQKVTQSTENQNFQAGEKRRERSTALDLVEAGQKARRPMSLSTAEDKAGSIGLGFALPIGERIPQRIDINQMPKLDLKPGENLFEGYQRHRKEMQLPNASAKFPTATIADMPPIDKTTASVSSDRIQPRESAGGNQFAEALKMANQGIEQRLDALRGAIMILANTPRSLTVQTPNPVDDAAKLMSDMSRGQLVSAGI